VAFHTLGHPELDRLGRALFAADFLEPGRPFRRRWRAGLRKGMPGELGRVVLEITEERVEHARRTHGGVRPESIAFLEELRNEMGKRESDANGDRDGWPIDSESC
jgi:2-amino-4-hydroxy-6-hydroxymethyldihydropteridine diphosphokinase